MTMIQLDSNHGVDLVVAVYTMLAMAPLVVGLAWLRDRVFR